MSSSFRLLLPLAVAVPFSCPPAAAQDDEGVVARAGATKVQTSGYFTRVVQRDIMLGMQVNARYVARADAANLFGLGTPWEALAQAGALARWDPTQEPLTYYHRTGPVGAIFHHLRTRKGGADARSPVGVIGLNCGTVAAFARRGQAVTFYESSPDLKLLVADTDRHFTYLHDAGRRGATVDVKFGPARRLLAADSDRRFALLLVEMIDTGFDPGDRLTLEAVRLYLDRTTPDGLVGLHVSNREFHLEPVVGRIARELRLAARVWHDDRAGSPGKSTSSWVVLGRAEADLGPWPGRWSSRSKGSAH